MEESLKQVTSNLQFINIVYTPVNQKINNIIGLFARGTVINVRSRDQTFGFV